MKTFGYVIIILISLTSCDRRNDPIIDEQIEENETYFPPSGSDEWETTSFKEAGWDSTALVDLLTYLEENDTRAFLVLKEGKIVVEEYWNKTLLNQNFTAKNNWYWASAAKTLTSFLVGQAQDDGFLDIDDSSQKFLGEGWSSLTSEQEKQITIEHHLTMTTGLDDSRNFACTDKECLTFLAEPGTRWSYHNAPYTILDKVIEGATNQSFDEYFESKLRDKIGMDGFWTYQDYNHLYYSTARSMARFGLLMLNEGDWNGESIIDNKEYLKEATTTSQDLNKSYGYLWWLNGKASFMIPSLQTVFNDDLCIPAPDDMYAALGKNAQMLNVVPSKGVVVVRMGSDPEVGLVSLGFLDEVWNRLNQIIK